MRSPPPAPLLVDSPAPPAPDARVCLRIAPEPQPAGQIVQPVTAEEMEATDLFLKGERALRDWAEGLADQLGLAQSALCNGAG